MTVVAPLVIPDTPDAHMSSPGLPVLFEHKGQMALAVHQMADRILVPSDFRALFPVAVVPSSEDVKYRNARQSGVKPRPKQVKGAGSVRKPYDDEQQVQHDFMVLWYLRGWIGVDGRKARMTEPDQTPVRVRTSPPR